MKLLLVDGSNLLMRAAFGGDISPERAVPIATSLIERAARQVEATHLVVCLDSESPSWRKQAYPEYKAHRTTNTLPWLQAGFETWTRAGWYVEALEGYEADDLIATVATRVKCPVVACSNDSDLLILTAHDVVVLRPQNGGVFITVDAAAVCQKYNLASVGLLRDFKALTGESGDNVPGVPGIGAVRAAKLLATYGDLSGILEAGRAKTCTGSTAVAAHEAVVTRARTLVTLSYDAPVAPIQPKNCKL
jgi:DNA polymerase-1